MQQNVITFKSDYMPFIISFFNFYLPCTLCLFHRRYRTGSAVHMQLEAGAWLARREAENEANW
jgi:hypothetical protein